MTHHRSRIALVVTGAIASLLIGFTLTPAFAGIVASIQNSTNTATTGTLTMKETLNGTSTVCNSTDGGASTNSATCSTINKYGGASLVPGAAATETTIAIQNTGTLKATAFSLTPSNCTQTTVGTVSGNATDLCAKVNVTIKSGGTTVFTGTAASLQAGGQIDLLAKLGKTGINASESVPFTISVQLDSSATAAYQGLQLSQPLTWTFSA